MRGFPVMQLLLKVSGYLFCSLPLLLPATDYHVARSGSDRNPGTADAPFRTLARGAAVAREPGDSIIIHEGIYFPSHTINLGNAGAEGKPIILRAAKGESVVIDGSKTPSEANLIGILGHHIRVEGLTIRNAAGSGIVAWGPGSRVHEIEVVRNRIHDCHRSAFYAGTSDRSDPIRNLLVEQNEVRDCVLRNASRQSRSWDIGIGGGLTRNFRIRNNVVTRVHGEGIGVYLSDAATIEGNRVYDNFAVNIYLDNTTNSRVTRNVCYSTGDARFFRFGKPTNGIQIANETYPGASNRSSHNRVTHNILIENGAAFCYGAYQTGAGLRHTLIAHNTAFGSAGALLAIDSDPGHQETRIYNNIFVQDRAAPISYLPASPNGLEFSHNLWFGGRPPSWVTNAGDLYQAPLFENPGHQQSRRLPAEGFVARPPRRTPSSLEPP